MASVSELASYICESFGASGESQDFLQLAFPVGDDLQVVSIGVTSSMLWMSSIFGEAETIDLETIFDNMAEHVLGIAKLDDFYATTCALFLDPNMKIKDWRKDQANEFVRALATVAQEANALSKIAGSGNEFEVLGLSAAAENLRTVLTEGSSKAVLKTLKKHESCYEGELCKLCEELCEAGEYMSVLAAANPQIDAETQEMVWYLMAGWQGIKIDVATTFASNPGISSDTKAILLDSDELLGWEGLEEWLPSFLQDLLANPSVSFKDTNDFVEGFDGTVLHDSMRALLNNKLNA